MLRLLKKSKLALEPNILITEFCNQKCPYCFAETSMSSAQLKTMNLPNFRKLIEILKREEVTTLRLLGGEPTLHPQFAQLVKLALTSFAKIMVFTNGLIPPPHQRVIESHLDRFIINFNIGTPAFEYSPTKRTAILNLIKKYCQQTQVNVGFTIWRLDKNYQELFQYFDNQTMKSVGIRFGYAKAILGQKQFFTRRDFKAIGRKIIDLIIYLRQCQVKDITIDCGLEPIMFTKNEQKILKEYANLKGWGCAGKWGGVDIDTDLTAFPCYPTSETKRISKDKLTKQGLHVFDGHYFPQKAQCVKDL